ncbi:hypothetical protein HanIR_Chr16g0839461 [Helianthus annuus]|nr:hypothetical protein HanIR_Chr16g0839461 [Helianthus annuus]
MSLRISLRVSLRLSLRLRLRLRLRMIRRRRSGSRRSRYHQFSQLLSRHSTRSTFTLTCLRQRVRWLGTSTGASDVRAHALTGSSRRSSIYESSLRCLHFPSHRPHRTRISTLLCLFCVLLCIMYLVVPFCCVLYVQTDMYIYIAVNLLFTSRWFWIVYV